MAVVAHVGLGGNLGGIDAVAARLRSAVESIAALPGTSVHAVSRAWRTPAWGVTDQPDFVNAVAAIGTTLPPLDFLHALFAIERAHGRTRADDGSDRWGPRTLDLDLLTWGDASLDVPGLHVPHPRLHERAFVLVPLAEVAPDLVIPGRGPVRTLRAAVADGGIEALPDALRGAPTPPGMPAMYTSDDRKPLTVPALGDARRAGRRLAMLTAYDAGFARAFEAAGVDLVLVGDSLGMVVQGHGSTLPVTVDDMAYHTACVARGLSRALLVSDLPFQSDATPAAALDAATRLLRAGAQMVKLEGAGAHKLEAIAHLVAREVPVCAHLGLTPQSVLRFGGYRVQGREAAAAAALREEAKAVEAAGASLLVLECVPSPLAQQITAAAGIPTIGIGAGPHCDGQVLVLHDLLGLDSGHRRPKFVKDFLADGGSVAGAVEAFVAAVRDGSFPGPEHAYA